MTDPWVPINDGIDRQRDFADGLYAQCGPDRRNTWSWTLLRYTDVDPEYVAWGIVRDEPAAKAAAESAAGEALAK